MFYDGWFLDRGLQREYQPSSQKITDKDHAQ